MAEYLQGRGTQTTYDYNVCPTCGTKLTSRNVNRSFSPPLCRKCANKKWAEIEERRRAREG